MDIMAQHLAHLRAGEPFLKPVYQHDDGTFGPLVRVEPEAVLGRRGPARLLHRGAARALRRARLPRAARGAAPQVEGAARLLAPRLHDRPGARRARPARARLGGVHPPAAALRRHRRLVPAERGRATRSTSTRSSILRRSLTHPDFRSVLDGEVDASDGIAHHRAATARRTCHIPGRLDRERAEAIEEMIWERLHFASHLRSERLGEFTIGTDLHRSESLALIQLLILYHLFTATASVAPRRRGHARRDPWRRLHPWPSSSTVARTSGSRSAGTRAGAYSAELDEAGIDYEIVRGPVGAGQARRARAALRASGSTR